MPTATQTHNGEWLAAVTLLAGLLLGACNPWNTSPPVCLAGAKSTPTGGCKTQRAPLHRLPFRAGFETKVMQAYHGFRTHKKDLAFSVDFRCDPGTPITASRDGIVWATREDSNRGCDDPSCVDDGNYVVIDHGDGTYSEYHHLQRFGALVKPGEQVCSGEVVGLCGNTGYTTGPHLHFGITDISHRTVPARLPREGGNDYPFPIPEKEYVSSNEPDAPCRETDYSSLPTDAFAHQGVTLDRRIPLVVDRGETETRLTGTYYGDHAQIAVHRKPVDGGEWIDECTETDEKGRFDATLQWPKDRLDKGLHWLIVTGADTECRSPGWAWSYKVRAR